MKSIDIKRMVLAALFVAIGFLLPFLTGQIQQIGNMLSPMHIPVLLCGFVCGPFWGLLVGAVTPLLRSLTLGMPPLMPVAAAMALRWRPMAWQQVFCTARCPAKPSACISRWSRPC